LSPSKPW